MGSILAPGSVAAIIPTRGDCSVGPIADLLRTHPEIGSIEFVIGNTPFNRYARMMEHPSEWFYTQDDDCMTDIRDLLNNPDPNRIVNAMTPEHAAQYKGNQTLIGFGALFHRRMLDVFTVYKWERDALFLRESDRIFPTCNPHKSFFPKILILPHAETPNRLFKQQEHLKTRDAMNKRIRETTGIAA